VLLAAPFAAPGADEPLDLAALIAEAEEASPEILAARARLRASEHVPPQMEARPDPTASVSYTNESLDELTLGSTPDSILGFSWTQEVPYPGKRRLAGEVARSEIEVTKQDLEAARLRVVSAVKRAYAELHRLDRTRAILEESRKLLESFLETARRRYETGEGILENVLKAQTELTRLDAELETTVQERRSAAVMLNALLGRRADAAVGEALDPPRTEVPDRTALEEAALRRSPEVLMRRAASRVGEDRLALARRQLKPDFMWTAAYMNRGGLDPMVMGMLGVRLPLYKKRRQAEAIVQKEHELEASRRDVQSAELRVLFEVRDLAARADRARTQMRLYSEGVIPQSRNALDSAAAAYAVGRVEFVTLIEDFLSVLDAEKEHEVRRAEEAAALAALESLTGAVLVRPAGGGVDE
jgi:outer membrane protein TolC